MKRFVINNNFKLRKEKFGGLIFIPATEETLEVNKVGYKKLTRLLKKGQYICLDPEELLFWKRLEQSGLVKEVN